MAKYIVTAQNAKDAIMVALGSIEPCAVEGCKCEQEITAALFAIFNFVNEEWPGEIFVESAETDNAADCIQEIIQGRTTH